MPTLALPLLEEGLRLRARENLCHGARCLKHADGNKVGWGLTAEGDSMRVICSRRTLRTPNESKLTRRSSR